MALAENDDHIFITVNGSHTTMRLKPMGALFGVLTLVTILGIAPHAFAATAQVTITPGDSSNQNCVTANNCFNPQVLNISPGDTVTWTNADTASHTATSGHPTDNVTGTVWDSSLIKPGGTYTTPASTFQNAGTYNYFCQVHPWMIGQIIVGAAATPIPSTPTTPTSPSMPMSSMTMEQAMSSDGSEMVAIDTTPAAPTSGQPLIISLNFTDASGNNIKHQNYNITLVQDGNTIYSNATGHTHTGLDTHTTSALTSSDPVDVQVTLNGIGLPGTDPSTWTGPKGDMITFNVVPEFGSIASIVLAIAVISIVVLTAKTRGIPKL
ncbi:MAG: PEFG-CTERM sorting domain-containing protein [Nitrosotalea sp.]